MVPKDDYEYKFRIHCQKICNHYRKNIAEGASWTDLIVLRLAEMYLTKAEAEFEMGNNGPAVTALNMTRSRAGISLVDATSITLG